MWLLTDPAYGVIQYAGDREDVRAAIERVAELYRHPNVGTEEAAEAAEAAARAAAREAEAAEAAWAAGAARAAEAAARAAEAAEARAVEAAGAAEAAAWNVAAADKLISLLEAA